MSDGHGVEWQSAARARTSPTRFRQSRRRDVDRLRCDWRLLSVCVLDERTDLVVQLLTLYCIIIVCVSLVEQKKSMENINSRLQLVMRSGKVALGYKQTLKALRANKGTESLRSWLRTSGSVVVRASERLIELCVCVF